MRCNVAPWPNRIAVGTLFSEGTTMQPTTIAIPAEILASVARESGSPDVLAFFEQQCVAAGADPLVPATWPAPIEDLAARLREASRDAKLSPQAQAQFVSLLDAGN